MPDNFLFYASWLDIIEANYPDDIAMQNQLIRSIVLYGIRGERNESVEKMFVQQTYAQIDSAKAKHDKRVEAGRNGGKNGKGVSRNQGNGNAKKKNNSKTIANDNVKENVNENNSLLYYKDNKKENAPTVSAPLNAALPAVQWSADIDPVTGEVRSFIRHELGANPTE